MSADHDMTDPTPVLERLKGFQRKTVDYAFRRMYEDAEPASRFLVADEVGLGKTQVAKGLIARVVAHKAAEKRRLDIIYICSNASIAAQNLSRLRLKSAKAVVRATRLTLLPLALGQSGEGGLEEAGVNFISFTPGTSFETTRRDGVKWERILIHRMLQSVAVLDSKGLAWVLRGGLKENWKSQFVHSDAEGEPDVGITRAFIQAVRQDRRQFQKLAAVCQKHSHRLSRPLEGEERAEALAHTVWLRHTLARCCLKALKPDLVVLDEFQRFRELLQAPDREDEEKAERAASAAELAQQLFSHENKPKILLLSATPYKMYVSQLERENHYEDFLATAKFLFNDADRLAALTADLAAFRAALVGMGAGNCDAGAIKQRIEAQLKRVMCRTERVGVTQGRDAMVRDVPMPLPLTAEDLADYACVDALARESGANDAMEFWRSSPYLLNFMRQDGYTFKKRMMDARSQRALGSVLAKHKRYRILKQSDLHKYKPMVAANPRLDVLAKEMKDKGSWRLLWVPPSMPYWQGEGAYADVSGFSKTLVFSSWNMVPDAVAGLLSYHAEQLAMDGLVPKPTYEAAGSRPTARLRFSSGKHGPEDMSVLALMFPSHALATLVDPLALSAAAQGGLTLADARAQTVARIQRRITRLGMREPVQVGPPDVRWYWLTLLMLERELRPVSARDGWGGQALLIGAGEGEDEATSVKRSGEGFARHVAYWEAIWNEGFDEAGLQTLGPRPADIAEMLADLALGGPAVCAFEGRQGIITYRARTDLSG